MIVQGWDAFKTARILLTDNTGALILSPSLLTSSGLSIALDANQRVKVLLDAVTGNIPVNLAASGIDLDVNLASSGITLPVSLASSAITLNVNLAASGITLPVSEQSKPYENITGLRGVINQTNLAVGTSTEYATAVTASQRWKLTRYAVRYIGTVAGVVLRPLTYDGSAPRYFAQHNGITSNLFYFDTVAIVLEAGWQVGCEVLGATAGDDLRMDLHYERIK